jgi:hypothetical protein
MTIKKMIMAIAVLGAVSQGVVCAESTPNPELKNPISFEIQELRETPVIDADHPDCKDNKYGFEGGSVVKIDGAILNGLPRYTPPAPRNTFFGPSVVRIPKVR